MSMFYIIYMLSVCKFYYATKALNGVSRLGWGIFELTQKDQEPAEVELNCV